MFVFYRYWFFFESSDEYLLFKDIGKYETNFNEQLEELKCLYTAQHKAMVNKLKLRMIQQKFCTLDCDICKDNIIIIIGKTSWVVDKYTFS